ncbi:MAG TPA: bifunctional oligoribonuclease/PAP phosphatase NrnA [Bacillota bacterium]|nr:bifunctional oligoribonuclease/PAP phosphatase NrnA [Bacillota bacterium]
MFKDIFRLISENETIVIARHKAPDLDAYGSQFGLYYALKETFPTKAIYAIGDTNHLNRFREMDTVDKVTLAKALLIILDTSVRQMMDGDFFEGAKIVVIMDHHQNDSDIKNSIFYRDTEISSTSELVATFLLANGVKISKQAAFPLFSGIVGDTGRFLFSTKPETFRIAALLTETGISLSSIYNAMYTESLQMKKTKIDYLSDFRISENGVGYRRNDQDFLERNNLSSQTASRGLVGQLSGIREIPIWANFTYDTDTRKILCELRSREIPIVDIAKKYGGGGHLLACGCSVASWEETKLIVADLDKLLEEKQWTNN